jgi:hypothetical protein
MLVLEVLEDERRVEEREVSVDHDGTCAFGFSASTSGCFGS